MITQKELTLLDNFDDVAAVLTYQLDHSGEIDFSDTEVRTEYLAMFLDFQRLLEDGEYSYRKVIGVLNEVDTERKFVAPLSLVDPSVARAYESMYGGTVTTKKAWERLSGKYVIEVAGRLTVDETVAPSSEDTEYARQVLTMMEVLLPMLNNVCEISDQLTDQLIAASDAHEKSMKQAEKEKNRPEISYADRRVLEQFENAVMGLSESLDYANGVDFSDAQSKAPFMELYLQLHTCLRSQEFSYRRVVKVLEKIDTEHKFAGFLTAAPFSVAMTLKESSRLLTGMTGEGFNDGEAFEYLGKKYFWEIDGEMVARVGINASPEDTGYAAQVMYMVDTLGYNMFGPLTGMAQELMR